MIDNPAAYYYINGKRYPLQQKLDQIAIRPKHAQTNAGITRSGTAVMVAGFHDAQALDQWPDGTLVLRQESATTRSGDDQDQLLRNLNRRQDIEFASPVYAHGGDDDWILTNRFVAQFSPDLNEWDWTALNNHYRVRTIEALGGIPRTFLLEITPDSPGNALTIANTYVESGRAVWAHPNFLRRFAQRTTALPFDQAHAAAHWHLQAIEAIAAWRISSGSPRVTVAILDDAVDLDHFAFQGRGDNHLNVIEDSDNPRPPSDQAKLLDHGTACAGLAVGTSNPDLGTSGVAPGCRLMAVRLLDRVIPTDVEVNLAQSLATDERMALQRSLAVVQPYREAKAILWAAMQGADVISNSWGPPDGQARFGTDYPIDDVARLSVEYASTQGRGGKGCVICWAAGNGNESISFDGYACHPQVLAVAACTVEGKRAPYSDFGPEVDICAPGGGYSDGLLTTTTPDSTQHAAYRNDFNGTSAATPIVAGVAALLLSANPELTRQEVYDILITTADRIDPEGGQYDERGHSPFYGSGRVNARRALERVTSRQ